MSIKNGEEKQTMKKTEKRDYLCVCVVVCVFSCEPEECFRPFLRLITSATTTREATSGNLPRLVPHFYLEAKEIIKLINDALFLSCSSNKGRKLFLNEYYYNYYYFAGLQR